MKKKLFNIIVALILSFCASIVNAQDVPYAELSADGTTFTFKYGIRHLCRHRFAKPPRTGYAHKRILGVNIPIKNIQQTRFVNEIAVFDTLEIVISVIYKITHGKCRFCLRKYT